MKVFFLVSLVVEVFGEGSLSRGELLPGSSESSLNLKKATLVVQGYSARRSTALCAWVRVASQWPEVLEAVLVVWNGARGDFVCGGVMESATWRERNSTKNDVSFPNRLDFAPRVHYAAEDRLDNHYVVPVALKMPSEVALVMDDDVTTDRASINCMLAIWRADPSLIVAPPHSARSFAHGIMSQSSEVFCAFLPQLVLVPRQYLDEYASHDALRTLVNATPVCEDYAFAAAVGHLARQRHTSSELDTNATAPRMVHAIAAGLVKRGGDSHTSQDLSGGRHFRPVRASCPRLVADLLRTHAELYNTGVTFLPSALTFQCGQESPNSLAQARQTAAATLHQPRNRAFCRV